MSNHHNHHHHNHSHEAQGKNLVISIFLNLIITLAQIIGGIISGSLALLSDALHNFLDVLALTFSWFANKLSKKEVSLNQTFGYKRSELIAAFVNSFILVIVSIYSAIVRFFHPETIEFNLVIWIALLSIILKGSSVLLLKKDSEYILNMKSANLYLLTNMKAKVAVLV